MTNCRKIFSAVLLYTVFSAINIYAASMNPFGEDPIDVQGGQIDYVKEKNAVAIRGYASISTGSITIKAKNMVYFRDTKEVYAEGDVSMIEPTGGIFYCESLYFNIKEMRGESKDVRMMGQSAEADVAKPTDLSTGLAGPGGRKSGWDSKTAMPFNRMFMRAKKIRSLGRDEQELLKPSLTTDNSPSPVFRLSSAAAQLKRNEKVESWHNVLWIGRVPVFYLPYIIKDLRYDWPWMRLAAGNSGKWGPYALSTWGIDLDPSDKSYFRPEKLFFDLDWRKDRGFAGGIDLKYEMGFKDSYGKIDTYYLKETEISRADDLDRAKDDTEYGDTYADDERWKVEWEHYQDLGNNWDLRAEANVYSDRDFLYEYFRKEYNEDKEPETAVNIRKLEEHFVFEMVGKKRVNDFMSQAEYLPEARFTLPGYQIGKTDYYIRNDTRVGYIGKRFDRKADDEEVFENYRVDGNRIDGFARAHTDTRIYRPFKLGKFATFTPYAGGIASYYESGYELDGEHARIAGLYGAELMGRFYGTYKNGTVRHIIEPVVSFTANEDPTLSHKKLYTVDEVDLYDELHYFTFSLHNKIQTRRMVTLAGQEDKGPQEKIVDLIDFDISTKYIPLKTEALDSNYGHHFTQLEFDMVYRPTDRLSIYGDLNWDLEDHYPTTGSLGFDWKYRDLLRMHTTHRFRRGDTTIDPHSDKSNETTFAFRWLASDKYSLEYAIAYEWANSTEDIDSGMSKQRVSLIRNLKVFELTTSYVRDARRDDHSVFVTLSPIGISPLERADEDSDTVIPLMDSRYHPATVEEIEMP
ncbi:MAG: LPS-assembly protein LptD [Planctomycetota bacterium]|jgi:hypothetical protein